MSELKAHLFVPYSELQEGDILNDAFTIAKPYYLKSEADKYIGELRKERDWLAKDRALACDDLEKRAQLNIQKDKEIAELKAENLNLKAKNIELQSFYNLHGNVDNYIDKLKAENEQLKTKLETVNDLVNRARDMIAELKVDYKEACDRLQTANLIKDEQLAAARHHKYKRCMTMANGCEYLCAHYQLREVYGKRDFFRKWMFRWLKLAEQFKEAK